MMKTRRSVHEVLGRGYIHPLRLRDSGIIEEERLFNILKAIEEVRVCSCQCTDKPFARRKNQTTRSTFHEKLTFVSKPMIELKEDLEPFLGPFLQAT